MIELELLGRSLRYRPVTVTTPDGLSIAAQDWGEPGRGRDVLLIHGYSQAGLCWLNQVTGPLAARHRLVSYDLRGHGASDKPIGPDCYRDPEAWAGEVEAVIAATGLDRPVIVAWSYAGRVAFDYLGARGDGGIAGLVLVSGTSVMGAHVAGPATPEMRRMAQARDLAENYVATRDFLARCVAEPVDPQAHELMMAWNLAVPAWVREGLGGRRADYDAVLASLAVPVLAIHGDRDAVNLPSMSEHTARLCPQTRLLIYQGIGHIPFWEAPERFDADLGSFLDAL